MFCQSCKKVTKDYNPPGDNSESTCIFFQSDPVNQLVLTYKNVSS